MSTTQILFTDPAALVEQLDAKPIRERLDAINRERQALLVLLRAALRLERDRDKRAKTVSSAE